MNEKNFCYHLLKIIHVPIYKYDNLFNLLVDYTEDDALDKLVINNKTASVIQEKLKKQCPFIIELEPDISVGVIKDINDNLILLGPVYFRNILQRDTQKENMKTGYFCNFTTFIEAVLMLHDYFTGECIDMTSFLQDSGEEFLNHVMEKNISSRFFSYQENGWLHNSYTQERREQDSIRNGDVEKLKNAINEPVVGKFGTLSRDSFRSQKNVTIAMIAISTRSAIEGGLQPEVAFTLCDSYILQIEETKELKSLVAIARRAEENLASLVAEQKKNITRNPLIEKSKNYIYKHMHDKISVKEMAEELNTNANYLSEVFHKTVGETIVEYTMRQKIHYAKNLLIYSNYSYDDIAYFFGFASRSHFGTVFKKITGMTPKRYRDANGVEEFIGKMDNNQ